MSNGLNGMNFASLFSSKDILCQTALVGRDEVLMELLRLAAGHRDIGNIEAAFSALVAREQEMPTMAGPGIAMPHARLEGVDNLIVSVATSRQGIRFADGDNGIAHLVILILVPKTAPGMYLQAACSLAKMLRNPASASRIAELKTADDVWRFFNRGGHILPDYVCAGDIMNRDLVTVKEADTLEQAIDMFVKHNVTELPVVDKDGDLVGMVSEDELLRVCLPDYILWMEDLSPIVNFQPFTEILRHESKTWLAEIMSSDYATVPEDAPAIQVAKEFRKHHALQVFVVRGKQLVGAISLQDFINKVLRE